jgi:hypothetical protein
VVDSFEKAYLARHAYVIIRISVEYRHFELETTIDFALYSEAQVVATVLNLNIITHIRKVCAKKTYRR